MNIYQRLSNAKLIDGPPWINDNLVYLTMHGSHAYKVNKNDSDVDIYGIVIPPKSEVFFTTEIIGFGKMKNGNNRFQHFQKHHIVDTEDKNQKKYDLNIANIVDFFDLSMNCNPNWLEVLYTDISIVNHCTELGKLIRDNRRLFLSKKVYFTMSNYAFSQISKAKSKERTGKRKETVDRLGYDPKMLYHCARLIDQCEQLLMYGDMELGRNKEYLKAIRREEISYEEVLQKFKEKEITLRKLYDETNVIPNTPRESEIKDLLFKCLEHHYGSLKGVVERPNIFKDVLLEIENKLRSISKELHS